MLDQNTDRMWYVIGAVLIGAAIIFGMNTLMPGAFASVGGMFDDFIGQVAIGGSESEIDAESEIDVLVADGYIPISTADELNSLRTNTTQTFGQGTKWSGTYTSGLDKKYIQVKDIDLSGIENFVPIGTLNNEFKGTFDGGGYVISNLTISRESEDNVGLFGRVNGATMKNIGLVAVDVNGGSMVGGLVGRQMGSSTVSDSYVTGSVTGSRYYTGGLVGYLSGTSTVSNSYATGSVTGEFDIGGLVGRQFGSPVVSNSYYDKDTTGQSDIGKGIGKTTKEMQDKDTYTGWDFETIWEITDGQYPTLR